MVEEILNQLQKTTDELIHGLSSLSQEQLNAVPFEGSWTAAQLGEHLHKSYNVAELLYGPVKHAKRSD